MEDINGFDSSSMTIIRTNEKGPDINKNYTNNSIDVDNFINSGYKNEVIQDKNVARTVCNNLREKHKQE